MMSDTLLEMQLAPRGKVRKERAIVRLSSSNVGELCSATDLSIAGIGVC